MLIRDMFEKDINRNINGVVKVGDNKDEIVKQELEEYIITTELGEHFTSLLEKYDDSLGHSTDKMGVWISGFFGSGKSHFLKILSYLLENREVGGKKAFDYFKDKFSTPRMEELAKKASEVPTETILFNVDIEGKNKNREAIKNVFAKVFYNHIGYYGSNINVVRLEQYLDEEGKLEAFKQEFEHIRHKPWDEQRARYRFLRDSVVKALINVTGMSKEAAESAFKTNESGEITIKELAADIKKYVDSKGKDFRLIFMVDEIGQYIGDDSDLMLNLQSLVEEVGTQTKGQVWVMVTSQESIDEFVKVAGDDFSKIQGRFDTRLSLSSADVDEVIKKRILEKTEDAAGLLKMIYGKKQAGLRNLFAFSDSILDIKGYTSPAEYVQTYPFVPYQFRLIPDVLSETRKHGNSGKHLSSGERSMLSAFQEAAQKVQYDDENTLVPFYNFYEPIREFLDGRVTSVIQRCDRAAKEHAGVEPEDLPVLKLLYLVRYITDIKANVENIAILMIDHIETDKLALKARVQKSLDRLYSQNYISRNGDTYYFLTDEEQDIAREIKNTQVDNPQIISEIGNIIYDDIYSGKRFRIGKNDYTFNQYIDDLVHGPSSSDITLRMITVANDHFDDELWLQNQTGDNQAFIVLSESSSYYSELEESGKIDQYLKKNNTASLPESVQEILHRKRREKKQLDARAKESLEKAVLDGRVFIGGQEVRIQAKSAKGKIDQTLSKLVEHVYHKQYLIETSLGSDSQIQEILSGKTKQLINQEAAKEVSQWLETRKIRNIQTTMAELQKHFQDAPYGWKEIDIAAVAAMLLVSNQIELKYAGAKLSTQEIRPYQLRNTKEIDRIQVSRRIAASETTKRQAAKFLRDYLDTQNIPGDEQELVDTAVKALEERKNRYRTLLGQYAYHSYPGRELLEKAVKHIQAVLDYKDDNTAFLETLIKDQDELLDDKEDLEDVLEFFDNQKPVFDSALDYLKQTASDREKGYFNDNEKMQQILSSMEEILKSARPYAQIKELPDLIQKAKQEYAAILEGKKNNVEMIISEAIAEIEKAKQKMKNPSSSVENPLSFLKDMSRHLDNRRTITDMDAAVAQIIDYKDRALSAIDRIVAAQNATKPDEEKTPKPSQPKKSKIMTVYRGKIFPKRAINSEKELDEYVEKVRENLKAALWGNDGLRIE